MSNDVAFDTTTFTGASGTWVPDGYCLVSSTMHLCRSTFRDDAVSFQKKIIIFFFSLNSFFDGNHSIYDFELFGTMQYLR